MQQLIQAKTAYALCMHQLAGNSSYNPFVCPQRVLGAAIDLVKHLIPPAAGFIAYDLRYHYGWRDFMR
jgi:hypothetical protein